MSEAKEDVVNEPISPYLQRAVIDSGPIIALFNSRDHWHHVILEWMKINPHVKLVTTWPVLTEVCALLAQRMTNDTALDALRWVQRGGIMLEHPVPGSLHEVLTACERFSDLPFDLADASVAETASRLKIHCVVSIDSDFNVYRDKTGKSLINLLTK